MQEPGDIASERDECDDQINSTHNRRSRGLSGVSGVVQERVCAGCEGAIREREYLSAMDADWHMSCLVCCDCQLSLHSQPSCYVKHARIYCKHDYFRLISTITSPQSNLRRARRKGPILVLMI